MNSIFCHQCGVTDIKLELFFPTKGAQIIKRRFMLLIGDIQLSVDKGQSSVSSRLYC